MLVARIIAAQDAPIAFNPSLSVMMQPASSATVYPTAKPHALLAEMVFHSQTKDFAYPMTPTALSSQDQFALSANKDTRPLAMDTVSL